MTMSVMFLTMRCQLDKKRTYLHCASHSPPICLWLFVAFIVFAAAASVAAAVAVWRGVYAPVCSAFCM